MLLQMVLPVRTTTPQASTGHNILRQAWVSITASPTSRRRALASISSKCLVGYASQLRYHVLTVRSVDGCIRFHRAQFLDVLVDHLPEGVAHFGKRLVTYRTTEHNASSETELLFADGSVATCNILVGCDGIKSVVRRQLLESHVREGGGDPRLLDHIEPVWSGSLAYRGLIPVGQMIREDGVEHRTIQSPMMVSRISYIRFIFAVVTANIVPPVLWEEQGGVNSTHSERRAAVLTRATIFFQHVVSYSISRGSIVNVVAMASQPDLYKSAYTGPWVTDCSREEVLDCFAGWEPEVEEMLKVRRCVTYRDSGDV